MGLSEWHKIKGNLHIARSRGKVLLELLKVIRQLLARWWSDFTLQTRLMAAATLAVSLIMSGLTFWAVNSIQENARSYEGRFGKDLGLLLASNVAPMLSEGNLEELALFSGRFYVSTSSIRYILFADRDGEIFFGIPFSEAEGQNSLTISRRIQLPENYTPTTERPLVRQHTTPDGEVTDVFVPLERDGESLGVMAVGINPNPTVVASSNLTRDVTIAVFITIWAMVILGVVLNALTITRPIKELLQGVRNIAAGRFRQRIELPFGGELGELIASFNDMAERLARYEEQNIEELTAEKAKLDTLVSTIADGAVLLDPDLQIVLANPTARRLFDWEGRNLRDEVILAHLPPAIANEIALPLQQLLASEDGKEGDGEERGICDEFRVTLGSVHERTARILLSRVWDQYRTNVKGIALTVQDITREVELNKAKSQFISNVSHELRTPLFNIKSFIETLYEYGEDLSEEERREFLQTTNHETDRLTRLVNDVLDLSRLESAKVYQMGAVELARPIEQTLRTYHLNARDKGIEIGCEIEADLPPVLGNYDLLLQVFANLVGNSLKFTQSGGRVAIRAERTPQRGNDLVRIEVADTGIGIDAPDRQAIFDRFFRVENQVHTLEGTGLGLSIVRNIVEKHRSHIHLVSEVGVGTTFWFDLCICTETQGPVKETGNGANHSLAIAPAPRTSV